MVVGGQRWVKPTPFGDLLHGNQTPSLGSSGTTSADFHSITTLSLGAASHFFCFFFSNRGSGFARGRQASCAELGRLCKVPTQGKSAGAPLLNTALGLLRVPPRQVDARDTAPYHLSQMGGRPMPETGPPSHGSSRRDEVVRSRDRMDRGTQATVLRRTRTVGLDPGRAPPGGGGGWMGCTVGNSPPLPTGPSSPQPPSLASPSSTMTQAIGRPRAGGKEGQGGEEIASDLIAKN